MKKLLFSLFAILSLSSCNQKTNITSSENNISSPSQNSSNQTTTPISSPSSNASQTNSSIDSSSSIESSNDFTIKIKDDYTSIEKDSFMLAKSNPDKAYDEKDNYMIYIDVEYNWFATDVETTIKIEDNTILKEDAIKLTNENYGRFYVKRIFMYINRSKILKAGKTKIKLEMKPTNEKSPYHEINTLCFELDIREYGKIPVEYFDNTTITVDKESLKKVITSYMPLSEISFVIKDGTTPQDVYGYNADSYISSTLDPKTLEGEYTHTFKFAKDHFYKAYIQYKTEKDSSKDYSYFEFTEDSTNLSKYEVYSNTINEPNVNNTYSEIIVKENNLNITLFVTEEY